MVPGNGAPEGTPVWGAGGGAAYGGRGWEKGA